MYQKKMHELFERWQDATEDLTLVSGEGENGSGESLPERLSWRGLLYICRGERCGGDRWVILRAPSGEEARYEE